MNKYLLFFLSAILLNVSSSTAQKEGNIWYFGDYAGLDFNSGSPVPLTNSAMTQVEGCASLADPNGNLLFYTDGVSVWDSTHNVMPNGTGLLGYWSCSQSAIIVPAPGNPQLKYIFTDDAADNQGINGVNYSIVDMSLNGGLGDVTVKNFLLFGPTSEKIAAVRHSNGTDFWVVAHTYTGDTLNAYLVSASGVNPVPVVSAVGVSFNGLNTAVGQLRFSSNGQRLAMTMYGMNAEVFDFDPSTGVASNPVDLNVATMYGVEFSPGGDLLYLAEYQGAVPGVYQFDMLAGSAAAINASEIMIGNSTLGDLGTMQLGPDHKIYIALSNWPSNNPYLARIESPDLPGMACTFHDTAVYLNGKGSFFGLPNIFSGFASQVFPTALFSSPNHICPGTCTDFINHSVSGTSFLWSFPGANPSTSIDVNPTSICYNTPGQYDVQLIATNANGSDTLLLHNYITVYAYPPPQGISQNGDTLFANTGAVSYQWLYNGNIIPGATNYFYVATESGNYNIVATDANGCDVEAAIFDVIAGVGENSIVGEDVRLFPNPVSNILNIDMNGKDVEAISIYNVVAEKVMSYPELCHRNSGNNIPLSINVQQLAKGTYWLEVNSNDHVSRTRFFKSDIH